MGFQQQVNVVNNQNITDTINRSVVDILNECDRSAGATQNFVISGDYNKVTNVELTQSMEVHAECFGDVKTQVKLAEMISNDVVHDVEAETDFHIGFSYQFNVSNVTNVTKAVQESVINAVQKCNDDIPVDQRFEISGNYNEVMNVAMKQDYSYFSTCIFNTDSQADISTEIANNVNQNVKSSSGSEAMGIIFIIIIALGVLAVVGIGGFLLWKNRDKIKKAVKMGVGLPPV